MSLFLDRHLSASWRIGRDQSARVRPLDSNAWRRRLGFQKSRKAVETLNVEQRLPDFRHVERVCERFLHAGVTVRQTGRKRLWTDHHPSEFAIGRFTLPWPGPRIHISATTRIIPNGCP